MPRHVKKGDTVIINTGDHKGRTGEVMHVDTDRDRVLIKGVNLRTKHVKPTRLNPQGAVITKEGPIHISNVSPVADGRATRVRFRVNEDGSKDRVAASNGEVLSKVRGPKNATKSGTKKKG